LRDVVRTKSWSLKTADKKKRQRREKICWGRVGSRTRLAGEEWGGGAERIRTRFMEKLEQEKRGNEEGRRRACENKNEFPAMSRTPRPPP
jgi:hypothetical protein